MSESGWTMYLNDSSWTCKDDTTHFETENASEMTKRVEQTASSMASDAPSGPTLHHRRVPSPKLDQSPYPISCSSTSKRLQQDLEREESCSSKHKKFRKNRNIRRAENNTAEWLQDTATSSRRSSTSMLVESEANVEKGALEQITAERVRDTKTYMEEDVGFCHENNINCWEQRMEINNHGVERSSPN